MDPEDIQSSSELSFGEPGWPGSPCSKETGGCPRPARSAQNPRGQITKRLDCAPLGLGGWRGGRAPPRPPRLVQTWGSQGGQDPCSGATLRPCSAAFSGASDAPGTRAGGACLPEPGWRTALGKEPRLSQSGGATSGGRARGAHALYELCCECVRGGAPSPSRPGSPGLPGEPLHALVRWFATPILHMAPPCPPAHTRSHSLPHTLAEHFYNC